MTTQTPNYGLHLYSETTDNTKSFLDFRLDVAGDVDSLGTGDSNMEKIDSALAESLIMLKVFDPDEDWVLEDGVFYFPITPELTGRIIDKVYAFCYTASSSGTPTVQIARGRRATPSSAPTWVDTLSTKITIDASEFSSIDGASQPVIDTSNDDLLSKDLLRIDIDGIGTGTKGLDIGIKLV